MAWSKTTWANLIGTQTTSTEVAPAGTVGGDIDTHGANKYVTLAVRCSVLFDNAPNKPTQIDFFPKNMSHKFIRNRIVAHRLLHKLVIDFNRSSFSHDLTPPSNRCPRNITWCFPFCQRKLLETS